MFSRRKYWLPAFVACALLLVGGCSTTVVSVASAPPGGAVYVVVGVLVDIINRSVPGVRANAEVTEGAVENVRLVGTGQSDIGFTILKTAQDGYQGRPPFKQPFPELRMLFANVQMGKPQVVVLKESPLQEVCDLKGKRIAVGPPGHGSIPNLREIFSAGCGFTFDQITPVYLPYDQSLSALGDRQVDAAVLYVPPPVSAIAEFGATHQYRLLPLSFEARDKVVAAYPYYVKTTIPAGLYEQVTADVVTVGTSNGFVVHSRLSNDLVYKIAQATFENLPRLKASHSTMSDFSLEVSASGGLIPYHEGVIRYYKEQRVWPEK